jgi:formylglycine-generating enzyme required for sulfatase activity
MSGKSRNGVEQLLGNAEEWTSSIAETVNSGNGIRLLGRWDGHKLVATIAAMGGSYNNEVKTADSPPDNLSPEQVSPEYGFRCVATG